MLSFRPNVPSYLKCEAWQQMTHSSADTVYIYKLECGLEIKISIVNWHWKGKFEFKGVFSWREGQKETREGLRALPLCCPWCWRESPGIENHRKVFIGTPHFLITYNCRKVLKDTVPFFVWHLFPAKWTGFAFVQNWVRIPAQGPTG